MAAPTMTLSGLSPASIGVADIRGKAVIAMPEGGSVPGERGERIVIRLTRGGLKNSYVLLAKHLDFLPVGRARRC